MKQQAELQILKDYKEQLSEPGEHWLIGVKEINRCINKYLFDNRLDVAWIKKRCHLNGKNYAGKFYYYTGFRVKEYIIYHRLKVSKILLKETEAAITDIAFSVGYRSVSAFCKTFKAKAGVSPTDWRKNH